MSAKVFYTNIFSCISSLSNGAIQNASTNIDTTVAAAYSKFIHSPEEFESVNLINNFYLKKFYDNVILDSKSLSKTDFSKENFIKNILQIDSTFGDFYLKTQYRNRTGLFTINTNGAINTESLIPSFKIYNIKNQSLDKISFGRKDYFSFQSDFRGQSLYTEVRECEGILLDKYYINFNGFWKEGYPWGFVDRNSSIVQKICSSYRKCKLYIFNVENYNFNTSSKFYKTYIFALINARKTEENVQDFTSNQAAFQGSESFRVNKLLYPFSVILDNSTIYRGVKVNKNLFNIGFAYPDFRKNNNGKINSDTSEESITANSMSCDLGGNLMIQYNNGSIIKVADSQLCGETTRVAFVRVDNVISAETILYKDLPTISNALNIYGYNFSYVKYLKNDESLVTILGSATVKTETNQYLNQNLITSNYFSYSFDPKYKEKGFLFTYVFRADNGSNLTDYSLNFIPKIKKPTVAINRTDYKGSVVIVSNYATHLTYQFNEESPTTVSITDTVDGTNQKTIISTSGKAGVLNVEVKNYFYDLDITNSNVFFDSAAISLDEEITIQNFQFQLRRSGSTTAIYDPAGTAIATLSFSELNQSSFLSYYNYSAGTSLNDFNFYFSYSGANIKIRLSDDFVPEEVPSGSSYTISKSDLDKFLTPESLLTITIIKSDGSQFELPIYIKYFYSDYPTVSNVSITKVPRTTPYEVGVYFSYNYLEASRATIQVLNDANEVIASRDKDLTFSTSTKLDSGYFDRVTVSDTHNISVKVTCSNLFASSGVESRRTGDSTSSAFVLPLRLSQTSPVDIKYYSDQSLATEVSSIRKGKTFYTKLLLYDTKGAAINTANYGSYVVLNDLTPSLRLNDFNDANLQARGVTFTRINYYSYSLNISSDTSINTNEIKITANYKLAY